MKNSGKEMVMFRNSRKGYDKNDVNRYIEDMNIRFTTAENRYVSTIRMLENDLENAKKTASNEEEIEALKAELATVKELLCQTEDDLEKQEKLLDEAQCEVERLKAEKPTVEVKTEVNYEAAESKIGSILVKANLDAQKIIADAEAEAAKKIAEAEKAADGIRIDATVSARIMTENTKKELAALKEEYIRNLTAISASSADEYRRLCEELKIRFEEAENSAKEKLAN